MTDNETDARFPGGDDSVIEPSAFPRKVPQPCPTCGLAVPPDEVRCPRCHTLLITSCAGACTSCGSRSCLRGDDQG